jgi:homoserine/homoserine lactone efflux protein
VYWGVAFANVIYFVLSATGIASLILASNTTFSIIKWMGVGYLIYLGMTAIFSQSGAIHVNHSNRIERPLKLFFQGFIVELANPKALLYFSALLPQFIDVNNSLATQLLIMGATCLAVDLVCYSIYSFFGKALAKASIKRWVSNLINKTDELALIFAGLKMATFDTNK